MAAAAAEDKKAKDTAILKISKLTIHIFSKEKRDFYDLEYIWQEAKKIRLLKRKKILKEEK